MEDQKFAIIHKLMDELEGLMQPGADDLGERLGRPKPDVAMMSIEAEPEGDEMPMGDDMDMEDPGEKLKQRLMRMRG